jgi:hypothetical protein
MPNVLILPRSADYSEEVWAEIRSKAASVLRSFFVDGVIPTDTAADDDDEDTPWAEEGATKPDRSDPSKRGGTGPTQPSAPAQDFRSKQQQLYYQA